MNNEKYTRNSSGLFMVTKNQLCRVLAGFSLTRIVDVVSMNLPRFHATQNARAFIRMRIRFPARSFVSNILITVDSYTNNSAQQKLKLEIPWGIRVTGFVVCIFIPTQTPGVAAESHRGCCSCRGSALPAVSSHHTSGPACRQPFHSLSRSSP